MTPDWHDCRVVLGDQEQSVTLAKMTNALSFMVQLLSNHGFWHAFGDRGGGGRGLGDWGLPRQCDAEGWQDAERQQLESFLIVCNLEESGSTDEEHIPHLAAVLHVFCPTICRT